MFQRESLSSFYHSSNTTLSSFIFSVTLLLSCTLSLSSTCLSSLHSPSLPLSHLLTPPPSLHLRFAYLHVWVLAVWASSCQNLLRLCVCVCRCVSVCLCKCDTVHLCCVCICVLVCFTGCVCVVRTDMSQHAFLWLLCLFCVAAPRCWVFWCIVCKFYMRTFLSLSFFLFDFFSLLDLGDGGVKKKIIFQKETIFSSLWTRASKKGGGIKKNRKVGPFDRLFTQSSALILSRLINASLHARARPLVHKHAHTKGAALWFCDSSRYRFFKYRRALSVSPSASRCASYCFLLLGDGKLTEKHFSWYESALPLRRLCEKLF